MRVPVGLSVITSAMSVAKRAGLAPPCAHLIDNSLTICPRRARVSWSTCILGAARDPPSDVAHVQFRSRIAFKLVWAPPTFDTFVLVDDDGKLLARGTPKEGSGLPSLQQRQKNFEVVRGGRYAAEAEKIST